MKLIVGLGNPGEKYARNRHNIGFRAADAIARAHGFGPWRAKFSGLVAEGRLGTHKVLLLKPQTYMNLSGQSVGEAARFYKVAPEDIIVLHDEIDLAPGKLRLKTGGGHAGHNGLRSIHAHIGEGYRRVRIGVGHPGRKELVAQWVLQDFPRADEEWIAPLLDGIAAGAPALAAGDDAAFLAEVNRRMAPLRERRRKGPDAPARAGRNKDTASRNGTRGEKAKTAAAPSQDGKQASGQDRRPGSGPDNGQDGRSLLQRLRDHFS